MPVLGHDPGPEWCERVHAALDARARTTADDGAPGAVPLSPAQVDAVPGLFDRLGYPGLPRLPSPPPPAA